MKKFYCQRDGGQWNVPVEVLHQIMGARLDVVRGLTSDLVGRIGIDAHCYALVDRDELFDKEQP